MENSPIRASLRLLSGNWENRTGSYHACHIQRYRVQDDGRPKKSFGVPPTFPTGDLKSKEEFNVLPDSN